MDSLSVFKVPTSTVFKTLLWLPSFSWVMWLACAAGLLLIVLGCFLDLRWLVLGLMIWLAVVPAVAYFQYVIYMMAPALLPNLLTHTVERCPDGYQIRIFHPADRSDDVEKDSNWIETGLIAVSNDNIVKIKNTFDYKILFLKNAPLSILFVPIDVLNSKFSIQNS